MYGINQYVTFIQTMEMSEQQEKVSQEIVIHRGHIEQHINSFVTHLNASHMPTDAQKQYIMGELYRLKETNSIDEATHLIIKIEYELRKMKYDLVSMRVSYFETISNTYTNSIYSILREGFTVFDRDNYIKALVLYSDVLKEFEVFLNESALKKPRLPIFYCNSKIYGDLYALKQLRQGKVTQLPNFMYNYKNSH